MVLATDASLVYKIEADHKTHSIFSLKIGQPIAFCRGLLHLSCRQQNII